jgi:heme exporter protein CcmD
MVVVLLIAWVWLDHRAQRRKLDELEARGITRRSAGTTS